MPESLHQISDPADRVAEAAAFLAYAEARVRTGRTARNDAIRAARAARVPRAEIARRAGISEAAVKAVLA